MAADGIQLRAAAPPVEISVVDSRPLANSPSLPAAYPPWPYHEPDEIAAAAEVLRLGRTNYWTGMEGRAFEQEFAAACGSRYGIALANGTLALELALQVLGIGRGDEVVVTPRSFVASAAAVIRADAQPVFADVDRVSQNIHADSIQAVLTPRTRAIIAVHLAGWPCEMDPILELARVCGIRVIEDCAQAHGATYRGRPVGSLGDVAAFSFCQDKILTTAGEGGLLTTNDEGLWRRAWSFKDHGKNLAALAPGHHPPGFRWLHDSIGSNYRLTEPQAAIGRIQLRKLEAWIARRRRNAAILNARLGPLPALRITAPPAHVGHAYYKYYVFVRPERLSHGWGRDRILAALVERGVPAFSGICPEIYRERAFAAAGLGPERPLPVARELGATSLMLLVHPTLDDLAMERMAAIIAEVVFNATQ
jgi:dTDP-4-amino-4,6-dideoxygalactose transaminase